MTKTVSCGGVVIYRGKILLLYKNYRNRYDGWVLPKGTVEEGENHQETATREVKEETGADAQIMKYLGTSNYEFTTPEDKISKTVHWYLMKGESFYSKPQKEEFFSDSGYYKYHEAIHLLKYTDERNILKKAYDTFVELKKSGQWY